MSISEKANDLLNKFGSAQFDFMVWNTPDNAVARDKARQEISDYIEELEAENDQLQRSTNDETVSEKFFENLDKVRDTLGERFTDENPNDFFDNLRKGA